MQPQQSSFLLAGKFLYWCITQALEKIKGAR